jgi:hypothetical protein
LQYFSFRFIIFNNIGESVVCHPWDNDLSINKRTPLSLSITQLMIDLQQLLSHTPSPENGLFFYNTDKACGKR